MIDKKEVGQRIRRIRASLGETAEKFGERFDPVANRGSVSAWENGRYLPNNERLVTIAGLAGVSVDELTNSKPLVTVKKVKKGTPTVIEYEGRRYILEHKDQYR